MKTNPIELSPTQQVFFLPFTISLVDSFDS